MGKKIDKCSGCDGGGIRCPATPSCAFRKGALRGWTIVERCDACDRYQGDLEAAAVLFEEVMWLKCENGGDHIVGRKPRWSERKRRRILAGDPLTGELNTVVLSPTMEMRLQV